MDHTLKYVKDLHETTSKDGRELLLWDGRFVKSGVEVFSKAYRQMKVSDALSLEESHHLHYVFCENVPSLQITQVPGVQEIRATFINVSEEPLVATFLKDFELQKGDFISVVQLGESLSIHVPRHG